jgi:hypothetical protein
VLSRRRAPFPWRRVAVAYRGPAADSSAAFFTPLAAAHGSRRVDKHRSRRVIVVRHAGALGSEWLVPFIERR